MPSHTDYKRLVIVDPQFKDQKGHNYRYAKGIAAEMGLPTVVLSHNAYRGDGNQEIEVRPCLSFDQYNNSAFKDGFRTAFIQRLDGFLARLSQRLERDNALWPTQSPLGVTTRWLAKLLSILVFFPALFVQLAIMVVGRGSSAHRDTTALELRDAFRDIRLGEGDLLVFQTMLWPTFESLLELRIQGSQTYDCDTLFIVHEDWLIYNTGFVRFTPAKLEKRVLQALPFQSSKVVSTNRPLSDFCEQASGYFPPVVREIESPVDALPEPASRTPGVTRILVPGVYRGDKNFESVPDLLGEIIDSCPDCRISVHESVLARVTMPPQFDGHYSVYADIAGAESWLKFLSEFDLILLPYGEAYHHRISGIIHQARLLNVPVVCHRSIADAALLANPDCCYTDEAGSIGTALTAGLHAAETTAHFRDEMPPRFTEVLADQSAWVDFKEKPIAVQVKPAWTRCGTTVVLDAQLDYLVDRNFFVIEVYLKTEPWLSTPEQVEFMWQLMRGGRQFTGGMVVRVLLKDVKLLLLVQYLFKLSRGKIPAFFKRENIHSTWCTPDPALTAFLQANVPELVLVNHMFNSDFAFGHIPGKRYICETHDLQINQLLRRRPELLPRYDAELAYELDLLDRYDAVVNLNRSEHLLIESHLKNKAFFVRPPILARTEDRSYCSLVALLTEQSSYKKLKRIPDKFDLLIVGDGHPANVESVASFIDKVYPELPAGTTLGIVGKLSLYLELDWNDARYADVHPVGFLDELCNLYEFTSLLVLPDVAGEGIPIKTDEAIARCVPFIATKYALRGFTAGELSDAGIVAVEDNADMVRQIIAGLNAGPGQVASRGGESTLSAVYSMEQYASDWDQVLENPVRAL